VSLGAVLFSSLADEAELYLSRETVAKKSISSKILVTKRKTIDFEIKKAIATVNKHDTNQRIMEKTDSFTFYASHFFTDLKSGLKSISSKILVTKRKTIDSEIEKAMLEVNKLDTNQKGSIVEENAVTGYAKHFFTELKSAFQTLYKTVLKYTNYGKTKEAKKIRPDCWQIGIDFSSVCNFIFFPMKQKKIAGILIDKGIMLDYINPAPVYCNF